MSGKEKIIHIIRDAVRKETEAFNDYRRASLKAGTVETESLLIQLAEEERKHRLFLLQELDRLESLIDSESSVHSVDYSEVRFQLPEILPFKRMKTIPSVDLATICLPVELFGGDFIDSFVLDEKQQAKRLGILLYDVMGHGFNSTRLKAEAKKAFGNIRETWIRGRHPVQVDLNRPNQVMRELNRMLIQDCIMNKQFLTVFYGVLDPVQGRLHYTSAGHEPPILLNGGLDYVHLNNTQLLIGAERNVAYQEIEVPFKVGDVLVLYSDGMTESVNTQGELFGRERIKNIVRTNHHKTSQEIIFSIIAELKAFLKTEPVTDELILSAIKIQST